MKAVAVLLFVALATAEVFGQDAVSNLLLLDRFDAVDDVIFNFYSRSNPTVPQNFTWATLQNGATFFNSQVKTRFIIHGWNSDPRWDFPLIRDAYLAKGETNVLTVDWEAGSRSEYFTSARRVNTIGDLVGDVIDYLEQQGALLASETYVIGHSMGAHIAGRSGRRLGSVAGIPRLGAVVALDAAWPYFVTDKSQQVRNTDARHVQLIKTSALGLQLSLGTSNFFVNYGYEQPPCRSLRGYANIDIACDHGMSILYFAESITKPVSGKWCTMVDINGLSGADFCRYEDGHLNKMGGEPLDVTAAGNYWVYACDTETEPFLPNYGEFACANDH